MSNISLDADAINNDHLRLAPDIIRSVGSDAVIAAAIYQVVGSGECFLSHAMLAKIAGTSIRTIERGLTSDSKLVRKGWLRYYGRQRFSEHVHKVRRTVSVQLTPKAIKAIEEGFYTLPRAIVAVFKGKLRWAERVVAAFMFSRVHLRSAIERSYEGCADDALWVSLKKLVEESGLSRNSVLRSVETLKARNVIFEADRDHWFGRREFMLNTEAGIGDQHLQSTWASIRQKQKPQRAWLPTAKAKPKKPRPDIRTESGPCPNRRSTLSRVAVEATQTGGSR